MNLISHGVVSLFKLVIFIILISLILDTACAHPGRTDSKGGHTCRTNCDQWGLNYGEYHFHNSYSAPPTPAPITPNPSPNTTNVSKPSNQTLKQTPAPTPVPTPAPASILTPASATVPVHQSVLVASNPPENQTEANISTNKEKGWVDGIMDFLLGWFKQEK